MQNETSEQLPALTCELSVKMHNCCTTINIISVLAYHQLPTSTPHFAGCELGNLLSALKNIHRKNKKSKKAVAEFIVGEVLQKKMKSEH